MVLTATNSRTNNDLLQRKSRGLTDHDAAKEAAQGPVEAATAARAGFVLGASDGGRLT